MTEPNLPIGQRSLPPAGWYPDPDGQQRWWDGTRWGQLAQHARVLRADRNGMGTAGFILALVSILINPLALVALPMSAVGLTRAKAGEATNKGTALAGLLISGAICALWILILILSAIGSAV